MRVLYSFSFLSVLTLTILQSCNSDQIQSELDNVVTVRLPSEPDMLNPSRSSSSFATQIESHIMYPLAEVDPETYVMEPLLVETVPTAEPINAGIDSGGAVFHYQMRKEAVWDDGVPVTGEDYAFTVKMALNPKLDVAVWRGFLTFITDVRIDENDPGKFDVIVAESYMLADVVTCNFNIYPAHIYDSTGYLRDFSVRALTNDRVADSLANADPRLQQFAESFMRPRFAKDVVSGSGPYRLASWETGQRIILERKTDWWGDKVQNAPAQMHGYPSRIIYEIIPDENTALTMLKDGSIDVISEISPRSFLDLRADSTFQDRLQFFTPKLLQCYYLELNGHNPILSDISVRRAIARVVDYNGIIENVTLGMAQRTVGPFHPDAEYYNHDITAVPFDLEKAKSLLSDAGWSDTNGNGILDKMIGGKRTELILHVTVSQRQEGQTIALLLKENAARAGIQIDIITKESVMQDARSRNFEILPIRARASVLLDDPYQNWHSSSDAPGGNNRSGFRNAKADSLITVIRSTDNSATRNTAYKELQVILAREQPVVFLYVPLERLIVSKQFEMKPSARRPGYFENLFVRTEL